jgi:hypothetical protein
MFQSKFTNFLMPMKDLFRFFKLTNWTLFQRINAILAEYLVAIQTCIRFLPAKLEADAKFVIYISIDDL